MSLEVTIKSIADPCRIFPRLKKNVSYSTSIASDRVELSSQSKTKVYNVANWVKSWKQHFKDFYRDGQISKNSLTPSNKPAHSKTDFSALNKEPRGEVCGLSKPSGKDEPDTINKANDLQSSKLASLLEESVPQDGIAFKPFQDSHIEALEAAYSSTPEGKKAIDKFVFSNLYGFKKYIKTIQNQIKDDGVLAYTIYDSGKPVGLLHTAPSKYFAEGVFDINTWIGGFAQGKGIMTQAQPLIMKHLYEREGAKTITWQINSENAGNLRVMQKLGFKPRETSDSLVYYNVSREQFQARQKAATW